MKKLFILGLLIILYGVYAPRVNAQMGSMMGSDETTTESSEHGQPIEEVLRTILSSHGVKQIQDLDCSKVTDDEFEKLGDSFMEEQHPGQAHEAMDEMMGGEGSESLRTMHINMGQGYLGCGSKSGYSMGGFGMMSSGMMGGIRGENSNYWGGSRYSNMMGYGNQTPWHPVFMGITWIAGIAFLVTGTLYFITNLNGKRRK